MKYTDMRNLKVTLTGGPDPHDCGIPEDLQTIWDNMTPEQLAIAQREMTAYRAAHPRPALKAAPLLGDVNLGDHAMLLVGTGGLAHAGMVISAIWKRLTK